MSRLWAGVGGVPVLVQTAAGGTVSPTQPSGQPMRWSDDALDALAQIAPADVQAAEALATQDGSALLQALLAAKPWESVSADALL